jgi:hypothetical protein
MWQYAKLLLFWALAIIALYSITIAIIYLLPGAVQ